MKYFEKMMPKKVINLYKKLCREIFNIYKQIVVPKILLIKQS